MGSILVPERGSGTPKPRQNIFILNIFLYQKTRAPYDKQFEKLIFGVSIWGVLRKGGTPNLCQGVYLLIVS